MRSRKIFARTLCGVVALLQRSAGIRGDSVVESLEFHVGNAGSQGYPIVLSGEG